MTELREEGGSTLESLLTLIASHTISRLDLTAALSDEYELRCLKNHSKPFGCFSEYCFTYNIITLYVHEAWSLLKSIPMWDKCLHERGVHPGYLRQIPTFSSTWETYLVSGTAGVSLWQAPSFWWDLHFQSQWNFVKCHVSSGRCSSLMVSALVSRFIGRVRALAGYIVLWIWARHFTLAVPLSTQVYKWVPANLMLVLTLRWTSIPSRRE